MFVCDNLMFDGEFVEFRKHTAGLNDFTLQAFCDNSVQKIEGNLKKFDNWHNKLLNISLPLPAAEHLFIRLMNDQVIQPSKFKDFYKSYFASQGEYHSEFPNLSKFHAACTAFMHRDSLFAISRKNTKLTNVLTGYIDWFDKEESEKQNSNLHPIFGKICSIFK